MAADTVISNEQVIFATGGYDHTIKIWQPHTGVCQRTCQHADSVSFESLEADDAAFHDSCDIFTY
jgi:WD40 repeat protein